MGALLAAFDKWRYSATAAEACGAAAGAARAAGWTVHALPLSDGGEGFLDALGGEERVATVADPLGRSVLAEWRLRPGAAGSTGEVAGPTGVVESARASGLALVGGPSGNDPLAASSAGTGQLVAAAVAAGATRALVGLGGSATTDGGVGAVEALLAAGAGDGLLQGVALVAACDVTAPFLGALDFAAQKGASAAQVDLLAVRLAAAADRYAADFGVDVAEIPGAGAAGGLGGGLAALGAHLVSGFDLVAAEVHLARHLEHASLVVTGEGRLDATSYDGKVVGGALRLARRAGVPALVVVGEVAPGTPEPGGSVTVISLVDVYGHRSAWRDPLGGIAHAVEGFLRELPGQPRPARSR